MSVKITISLDEKTRSVLTSLARKRKNTVSGLISEWVEKESRKEKNLLFDQGLGSLLRSHDNILKNDSDKDYKTLLRELREEKLNK